ncbi:MAG: hypothetical protein RSA20_05825 [Oscillospiraceae bacterium]
MKIVEKDGLILAKHITPEDWNEGLSFFSNDNEFIQVGAWKYDAGKELLAHIHNEVERKITRTCETLYIVSGAIHAKIYSLGEELVDEFDVHTGDVLILLDSGHGYSILEDGTKVLEVKNGPYLGAEIDRRRI